MVTQKLISVGHYMQYHFKVLGKGTVPVLKFGQ